MIQIRPCSLNDHAAVHTLTLRAFGRAAEADLNDALRAGGKAALELVADEEGRIVGHVMFAPVEFAGARGVSLGPICVDEAHRGRGIMRGLVEAGLEGVRAQGFDFAMLLGSPSLYPRFGFAPGAGFGMRCDVDVPEDEFMVLELCPGALRGKGGVARFAPEFDGV